MQRGIGAGDGAHGISAAGRGPGLVKLLASGPAVEILADTIQSVAALLFHQ
ncbi:hypothetical protein [Streptomyces sp. NPDC056405]|uniref:hypothetical protein n=1 Tax=Streptomyces sp. NPDC056405 TaxID=3345811 RepID=UPI0035E25155